MCRIFDMEEYKHNASDKDVKIFYVILYLILQNFKQNSKAYLLATTGLKTSLKTPQCKKIGFIIQSKILNDITIEDLYERIKEVGIDAKIENNKIVVPSEIPKFETFLKCLSGEVYNGGLQKKDMKHYHTKNIKIGQHCIQLHRFNIIYIKWC